ncbi:MAG: hypothetical protein ACK5JD_04115 [Mangrovibacterium sp.]
MRKFQVVLLILLFTVTTKAQEKGVSNSVWGVQTGLFGAWVYNEARLSDEIALRTELGFDYGFQSSSWYDEDVEVYTPVITLEPRWYFNLKKRQQKSRKVFCNTGNFLSLKTSFHPGKMGISNVDGVDVVPDISIIPTWGIRRHMGQHFAFETGVGLGWAYVFWKSLGYVDNESEIALNLHLRLGYTF